MVVGRSTIANIAFFGVVSDFTKTFAKARYIDKYNVLSCFARNKYE